MSDGRQQGVELTYGNVSRALAGLNEIARFDIPDFNINLGITRAIKKLVPVEAEYNRIKKGYMDEHIAIDDSTGTYKVDGNRAYVYNSEKDKQEYSKKLAELNSRKLEGLNFTIAASELKKLRGLKGSTMVNINEFIADDLD